MPNRHEKLTLPTPAQTLWREAQQVIHEELQQFGTPRLGGGTTLGARWKHRESSDIDLTIEPKPGGRPVPVSSAILSQGSRFLSRLESLNLGTVECEILTQAQFHVTFHDPDRANAIRFGLDIASVGTTPRLGEQIALVEGTPAVVLSTTQILTGKLHRWGEATMRDAIDFNQAARRKSKDLDSLAFAINTLSSNEADTIKHKFLLATAKFGTIDDPIIRRMAPEHQPNQATLGQTTAELIHGLRYAEVSITVRGGICHFEATTRNKHQIHLRCREQQVEPMFATCGIDEYLHSALEDPGRIRNQIQHACRRSWRKHPPVLQKTHPTPDWKPTSGLVPGGGVASPPKAPESAASARAKRESKQREQRERNDQSYTH